MCAQRQKEERHGQDKCEDKREGDGEVRGGCKGRHGQDKFEDKRGWRRGKRGGPEQG